MLKPADSSAAKSAEAEVRTVVTAVQAAIKDKDADRLWALMVLELWMRQQRDGLTSEPASWP